MNQAQARSMLARLIACASPKADAEQLVNALFSRHGSIAPIMESLPGDLPGVPEAAARLITLIPQLARYTARERAQSMKCLNTFKKAGQYLSSLYLGQHNESAYLLSLDAAGHPLNCSLLEQGTVDEAPFYVRRILEVASRVNAYAVVLSHNHPSGTCSPSPGDIQCTVSAIKTLMPMDIQVLDHIIIACGTPVSIRACGDIADVLFTRQNPGSRLMADWFSDDEETI